VNTFRVALRQPELRRRLLITVGIIGVFRLGSALPAPGIAARAVRACISTTDSQGALGLVNLISGGALLKLSIFALGVTPYITASIMMQLLAVAIPRLSKLRDQGNAGQTKLLQYSRYLTIALGLIEATTLTTLARGAPSQLFPQCTTPVLPDTSVLTIATMVLGMTAGTAVVMWLAEQVTTRGVGNGMSLLIFTAIVARLPSGIAVIAVTAGWVKVVIGAVIAIAVMTGVIFMESGMRRIPVTYPRRVYRAGGGTAGTTTHLPMRVNQAGVVPILFASSLLYLPALLAQMMPSNSGVIGFLNVHFATGTGWLYLTTYLAMTVFFAFFYTAVTADVTELSDGLRERGAFVPGVRPGAATVGYLGFIQSRLTMVGAFYLCTLALLPYLAAGAVHGSQTLLFGGTSVLIVVGVALSTVRQIETQASMTTYSAGWFTRERAASRRQPNTPTRAAGRAVPVAGDDERVSVEA
jgi:preprotein translocase subunit SecY